MNDNNTQSRIPATRSRLAGMVRRLVLGLVLAQLLVIGAVCYWSGPPWTWLILLLAGSSTWLFMLPGFARMAIANRRDPAPRASLTELLFAWWIESWTMLKVFGWWQPFGWRQLPDSSQTERSEHACVVFIHGFVCNRGLWRPWMRFLRDNAVPYVSVNLEPLFGSIDKYVSLVEEAVGRAEKLGGRQPLLVCHSMGGLAARAWLASEDSAVDRVEKVITIGSPHHGTLVAEGAKARNGQEMRLASDWLVNLAQRERVQRPERTYGKFVNWYSNTDNIVFPASTSVLVGADCRLLRGQGHVALTYHRDIMQHALKCAMGDTSGQREAVGERSAQVAGQGIR
ncbi:MAG: alpha/beta fold hydrolase [Pirellulaceae bacterium]|nr:alpha/beta fold hydrolase [Pirellulaceae bacterium]